MEGMISSQLRRLRTAAVGYPVVSFFPLFSTLQFLYTCSVACGHSFPFAVGLSVSPLWDLKGSAPAQPSPSSLSWLSHGLSSPRDLHLPSLSLVLFFPSPVGRGMYQLYCGYVHIYMQRDICKLEYQCWKHTLHSKASFQASCYFAKNAPFQCPVPPVQPRNSTQTSNQVFLHMLFLEPGYWPFKVNGSVTLGASKRMLLELCGSIQPLAS